MTHGQDFSHMYAQPTIINVHVDNEDQKRIEVSDHSYIDSYCNLCYRFTLMGLTAPLQPESSRPSMLS